MEPTYSTAAIAANADRRSTIILILSLIIAIIGPFASDSYLPSLPAMTHALTTTTANAQLTITLFFLGFAGSQLIYGPLSDRYGRRLVILLGLGICTLGSLVCAIAPTIHWLLIGRLIQGCGAGVTNSIFRAIIRDTFQGARMAKMTSFLGIGYAMAPAVAPILGGYIHAAFGWRANFIFLLGLITTVWLIMWYFLPETDTQLNPTATKIKVVLKNYKNILTNKTFLGFTLCSSLAYGGIIAYLTTSPFLLQNVLGLSPVEYGWVSLVFTIGLGSGQLVNALLVEKLSMYKMLFYGIILMLSSGALLFLSGVFNILNVIVVLVPACLFIFASAFVFANAMAGALLPFANMAGSAAALYGCLQISGCSLSSFLVASLHSDNQFVLATLFICIGLLAIVTFHYLVRPDSAALIKKPTTS